MDHEKFLFGLGDHDAPTSAEEANSIAELTREFEGAISLILCNIYIFLCFIFYCNLLYQLI